MRAILVLAALLAAMPLEAFAQAAPPEGCFCLRHVASGQVLRGCSGYKPPGGHFSRALCKNEKGQNTDVLVTDDKWLVVPDGEPACSPCQPKKREFFEGLRQDKPNEEAHESEQRRSDPR